MPQGRLQHRGSGRRQVCATFRLRVSKPSPTWGRERHRQGEAPCGHLGSDVGALGPPRVPVPSFAGRPALPVNAPWSQRRRHHTSTPRPHRLLSLSPSRPAPEAGLRLSRRPAVLCLGAASLPTSPSARGPRPRPPACGVHLPPAGRHVFPPASCRSDGNLRALGPRRPPSATRRSSSATAAPPAAAGCRAHVSVSVSLGFFLCVLGPSCRTSAPLGGLRHSGCLCPQALRRWHCLSSDLTRAVGGARSARCTVTPPVSGCSVGSGRPGAGPRVSLTVAHDGAVPSTVVALARRAADPGVRVSVSAVGQPGPPAPSLGRIFYLG